MSDDRETRTRALRVEERRLRERLRRAEIAATLDPARGAEELATVIALCEAWPREAARVLGQDG